MPPATAGWFEPIENGVQAAQRAREGLIAGGDLAYAGYTYMLPCRTCWTARRRWTSLLAEIDGGAGLRAPDRQRADRPVARQLPVARPACCAAKTPPRPSEAVPLDRYADNPLALFYAHSAAPIAAAIFGDPDGLAEHSAAAMQLLAAVHGFYPIAQVRLLRGLALAEEARATDGDARDDLLAELDEVTGGWPDAPRTRRTTSSTCCG